MPLHTPPDQWLQIGALKTRYWQVSSGNPPVLLVHGVGGSMEAWHRNVGAFAARHQVFAVDLPGSGCTERPPLYPADTLGLFADFLCQFLDATAVDQAVLIGSSLGGAVSIECALRYPERVRALVLVGSSGFTTQVGWPLRIASLPLVGEQLTRPNRKNTARSLRAIVANPDVVTDDEIDAAYALACLPGAQQAFLDMLRVYCTIFGVSRNEVRRILDSLPRIRPSVLLVWGEHDRILPVASAHAALARLPNARLVVMEGCGHVPFVEKPDEFNQLVERFIEETEQKMT